MSETFQPSKPSVTSSARRMFFYAFSHYIIATNPIPNPVPTDKSEMPDNLEPAPDVGLADAPPFVGLAIPPSALSVAPPMLYV